MENNLAICYKIKHIQPNNLTSRDLPKWIENLYFYQHLHADIYRRWINNCWQLETTSKWMNKQCYMQTMEYYSALKKNQMIDFYNNVDVFKIILLSCATSLPYWSPGLVLLIWLDWCMSPSSFTALCGSLLKQCAQLKSDRLAQREGQSWSR